MLILYSIDIPVWQSTKREINNRQLHVSILGEICESYLRVLELSNYLPRLIQMIMFPKLTTE